MPSILTKRRNAAYSAQQGRCYYCSCLMLPCSGRRQSSVEPDEKLRACTAEHLQARRDGGRDSPRNVVAACWYCNHSRHALHDGRSPRKYRQLVRTMVARGAWPTTRSPFSGEA